MSDSPGSSAPSAPAASNVATHSVDSTPGVKQPGQNPDKFKWNSEPSAPESKMAKDGKPSSQIPQKINNPDRNNAEGVEKINHALGKQQHEKNVEEMARRVWKLKDAGKEIEVDSEDKLLAFANKGLGLDRKVSDQARLLKEYEQKLNMALQDPDEFYKQSGKNPKEIYEQRLIEQLKREQAEAQMSPEARRWQAEQSKMQQEMERDRAELNQMRQERHKAQVQHHMEQIDNTLLKVFQDPEVNLPKTEKTVERMVEMMLDFDAKGIEADPKHIAQFVNHEMEQEQLAYWGSMKGDQLLAKIPKAILDEIRRADLDAYRRGKAPGNAQDVAPQRQKPQEQSDSRNKKQVMTKAEWEKYLASF